MHFSAPEANCDLSQVSVCILQRQMLSLPGLPDSELCDELAVSIDDGMVDDTRDEGKLF
jgi:hypothetical protein